MKNILYYALFATMVFFAACSQDETLVQENKSSNVSFRTSLPSDGLQTRAANESVKRYIMQIYKDGTVVDLDSSEEGTNYSITKSDGSFEIDGFVLGLENGTTYTAVFWADYDELNAETPTYATDWLNWISLNEGKEMTMAYCGLQDFTYGSGPSEFEVTLKRAVAQVNLKQKTAYTAGEGDKIKASYKLFKNYSALASDIPSGAEKSDATTEITVSDGEKSANAVLGSFLVFATTAETATLTNFAFSYGESTVGNATNVPLKANYQTNITGDFGKNVSSTSYKFIITTNSDWNGLTNGDTELGEGGEMPSTDTAAPTFVANIPESVAILNGSATINYSIEVTDETALATSGIVKLYKSDWSPIESKNFTIEDNQTEVTMAGSFTVTEAGSYIIDYTVYDAAGNQGYANTNVTVNEAE